MNRSDYFSPNYCPKCGGSNFQKKHEKLYACGDCGFQYYHNPAAAVAVILEYQDQVVFTVRNNDPAKGTIDLPGGFVDELESAEQAAVRELKEELGISLDIGKLSYFVSFPNQYPYKHVLYNTVDIIFTYTLDSLPNLKAQDDVSDVVLKDPRDLNIDEIGLPSIKKTIAKYNENKTIE